MNTRGGVLQLAVPFTPLPNEFIDKIMPTLKDTEWRLLCVIARQTIGWSDGKGKRKQRDWLTQDQLLARTGRSSAALSAALDVLIRRRLIYACDVQGDLLPTPQQRRRHRSRIFYGLCLPEGLGGSAKTKGTAKSELQKANITKETEDKRKIQIRSQDVKNQDAAPRRGNLATEPMIYEGWRRAGDLAGQRCLRVN